MVAFSEVAKFASTELGAIVLFDGDDFEIGGVATSASWGSGRIAFAKSVDADLEVRANAVRNGVLIVGVNAPELSCARIVVENPRNAYARIASHLFSLKTLAGIHPTAIADETAEIDESATVGPYCVVGPNSKIGARTVLHNHVVISRDVIIGADCVFWSHVAIGEYGFGGERGADGSIDYIPHLGGVRIGDRVHVGNGSMIASGTIEATVVESGTMIDNLVHVGHNSKVGTSCQLTACSELSGSVTLGKNVWLAPNSSVIQKVEIGENAFIGLGAAVTKSMPSNVVAAGVPARVLKITNNEE